MARGQKDHQWDCFDPAQYNVRSETYLSDRVKEPSGPTLLELVNMDMFLIPPDGPIQRTATHRDCYRMNAMKQGDDRFLFIVNWIFAPYQGVLTAALDPQSPWLVNDTPQGRVWNRFLEASLQEQK